MKCIRTCIRIHMSSWRIYNKMHLSTECVRCSNSPENSQYDFLEVQVAGFHKYNFHFFGGFQTTHVLRVYNVLSIHGWSEVTAVSAALLVRFCGFTLKNRM